MLDQYVTDNFPTVKSAVKSRRLCQPTHIGLSGEVVRRSWASFQGRGRQHFAKEGKNGPEVLDPGVEDKRAATQFLRFF